MPHFRRAAYNIGICAIGAKEYRTSTFVILIICSNLAVILFLKATPKVQRTPSEGPFGTGCELTDKNVGPTRGG